MHLVVGDLVLLHGAEGAKTHMERHIADVHALGLDLLQQLRGEVQSRRRGRRAAQYFGVYRLIPLLILKLLLDVGRQGHFTQMLQNLQENSLVIKAHQTVAVRQDLCDLCRQLAVAEGEFGSLPHMPSRAHQTFPRLFSPVDEQQHLTGAASRQTLPQQTGGQHPGIVQDQAVTGVQEVRQLVEMVMLPGTGVPVQSHEPGTVPPLQRRLGDQFLRELVVKIACFHVQPHLMVISV